MRDWRKFRGKTLEELSEATGLGTSTISNIERNVHGYTSESLELLAEALDCEPGDLLSRPPIQDEQINSLWMRLTPKERAKAIQLIKMVSGEDDK